MQIMSEGRMMCRQRKSETMRHQIEPNTCVFTLYIHLLHCVWNGNYLEQTRLTNVYNNILPSSSHIIIISIIINFMRKSVLVWRLRHGSPINI